MAGLRTSNCYVCEKKYPKAKLIAYKNGDTFWCRECLYKKNKKSALLKRKIDLRL